MGYVFSEFPVLSEAFAVSDILALLKQGHDVRVFTIKPGPSGDARLRSVAGVPNDLPILRPTVAGALRWPMLVWRYRAAASRLAALAIRSFAASPKAALGAFFSLPRAIEVANEVRRSGMDVVHVFWSRQGGMVLPVLEREGAACLRSAFVGAYDLVADDFLVDLTLKSAEIVFSHAEANRSYAEARVQGGTPVHIVRRGIPLPDLEAEQRDRFTWITASALTESKNTQAVLLVFARAWQQEPRLRLLICGDGPQRSQLERLARDLGIPDQVVFAGHVPRDELFTRLARSNLFILLSTKPSERLPNVIKEALWAGCAVICSRSEGIEELIPNEQLGTVVDPHDEEAICRASERIAVETEAEAAARRAAARDFVRANFSSDRGMERYMAAWLGAARTRGGAVQAQTHPLIR